MEKCIFSPYLSVLFILNLHISQFAIICRISILSKSPPNGFCWLFWCPRRGKRGLRLQCPRHSTVGFGGEKAAAQGANHNCQQPPGKQPRRRRRQMCRRNFNNNNNHHHHWVSTRLSHSGSERGQSWAQKVAGFVSYDCILCS
jgi:hypothetical protein